MEGPAVGSAEGEYDQMRFDEQIEPTSRETLDSAKPTAIERVGTSGHPPPHRPVASSLFQVFITKMHDRKERGRILAFILVAAFLLWTFCNSMQQNQIKRDLRDAKVVQRISSQNVSQ